LLRKDQSVFLCELTLSIRTRNLNDEDKQLGFVDLNPSKNTGKGPEKEQVKEILLCIRPIKISNNDESDDSIQIISSVSEGKTGFESGCSEDAGSESLLHEEQSSAKKRKL
jgi:hypothetical protein